MTKKPSLRQVHSPNFSFFLDVHNGEKKNFLWFSFLSVALKLFHTSHNQGRLLFFSVHISSHMTAEKVAWSRASISEQIKQGDWPRQHVKHRKAPCSITACSGWFWAFPAVYLHLTGWRSPSCDKRKEEREDWVKKRWICCPEVIWSTAAGACSFSEVPLRLLTWISH